MRNVRSPSRSWIVVLTLLAVWAGDAAFARRASFVVYESPVYGFFGEVDAPLP